jgi:preprotein translocase subunit SecE
MAKDVAERQRMTPVGWYQSARDYASDVQNELKKVTWPPRKETVAGTIGVVVIVGVITIVLGVVDVVLAKAVQLVLP